MPNMRGLLERLDNLTVDYELEPMPMLEPIVINENILRAYQNMAMGIDSGDPPEGTLDNGVELREIASKYEDDLNC